MSEQSIDDVLDDLIEIWHTADGIQGVELHEFLGFTEAEYGIWVGPDVDARVIPQRLHGYLRWLHDRVWVGPGHEVRWAGRMMRELHSVLGFGDDESPELMWYPLLRRVRALCQRHIEKPDDGEPKDGHTFEVSVRHRGAYGVGPDFQDMVYEDSRDWTEPQVVYIRAWSLMEGLVRAAALPFSVWMSHYEREEEPS